MWDKHHWRNFDPSKQKRTPQQERAIRESDRRAEIENDRKFDKDANGNYITDHSGRR